MTRGALNRDRFSPLKFRIIRLHPPSHESGSRKKAMTSAAFLFEVTYVSGRSFGKPYQAIQP
jgi:hypothetical protein